MAAMDKQLRDNEAHEETEIDVAKAMAENKKNGSEKHKDLPIRSGNGASKGVARQVLGNCKRCGYMSSQDICQACMLLEGLNKNRAQIQI
jgi:cytoplasmic tRNA 2-thiolation protein 1